MTTPTPRTDAEQDYVGHVKHPAGWMLVRSDFARQLEQELNEAREQRRESDERIGQLLNERDTLKREMDEAKKEADRQTEIADAMTEYQGVEAHLIRENLQLRKVADELAQHDECCHGHGKNKHCGRCKALELYNQLPHVQERKTK